MDKNNSQHSTTKKIIKKHTHTNTKKFLNYFLSTLFFYKKNQTSKNETKKTTNKQISN